MAKLLAQGNIGQNITRFLAIHCIKDKLGHYEYVFVIMYSNVWDT